MSSEIQRVCIVLQTPDLCLLASLKASDNGIYCVGHSAERLCLDSSPLFLFLLLEVCTLDSHRFPTCELLLYP